MNIKSQVLDACTRLFGQRPAEWAPGVTELGWTLHVSDDGDRVTINQALGSEYKHRVRDHLALELSRFNLPTEVVIGDVH